MYAELNGAAATGENYDRLTAEDKIFNQNQTAFVIALTAILLLAGYTAADMFFFHAAFPMETAYTPENSGIKVALNYRF